MGKEGEELTEQETAIYDRQIRVWGVDAQRRSQVVPLALRNGSGAGHGGGMVGQGKALMGRDRIILQQSKVGLSKSHIFVSGLKGTVIEFCKNIVLAGVGSLMLNDDRLVTEELLSANFLVPSDENVTRGKSLAELCCESLKDFNPMVSVSVEKGDLANFDVEFFQKLDAVVISCCSLLTKKSVNAKCRKSPRRVAFYSVECRDSCGEIFVDLQNYSYSKKKNEETIECHLQYPSFEDAIAVPWRSLPMRTSKLYFAMRVIERFEELEKRNPQDVSAGDLPNVLKLRKELCEARCMNESQIPDLLLQRLLAARVEFPPVCAIIGGVLGQEVIKAISGKDVIREIISFGQIQTHNVGGSSKKFMNIELEDVELLSIRDRNFDRITHTISQQSNSVLDELSNGTLQVKTISKLLEIREIWLVLDEQNETGSKGGGLPRCGGGTAGAQSSPAINSSELAAQQMKKERAAVMVTRRSELV
ncbi:SUMO-activating enzyme subunit 1B-1 [Capsicum annuum]|nr:SUMO-activating enzyme subunit 1B-1 [Capsicum annuum]